jgi:hypothetical protein
LVDVAHPLRSTLIWLSGATCLVVFRRPIHGRSPVLVDAARLLHGTPVWLSCAVGGTLLHSAFAIVVTALDAVVQGVGPTVSRWLPQLDGVRSPHTHDRLGGRLRCDQPYPTPPRSHLLTHTSFACPPFLHRCW